MAILEDGAFFGEIALFKTKTRTMTVQCLTEAEFLVISKEKLINLLEFFPEERKYILKVAEQRMRTTAKYDIPIKEVF